MNEVVPTVFFIRDSRASSRVMPLARGEEAGRVVCIDERGVCDGVVAAEAVLFLLDLKMDMAES